jgi:hypothetical protein
MGNRQHKFKRNRSTSTHSAELQSILGIALNKNEFIHMSSLDPSSAFDIVNLNLLLKRLEMIRLPNFIINDLLLGTVLESILGSVMYAIFMPSVFGLENMFVFEDDSFIPRWDKSLPKLIKQLEKSFKAITNCLRQSDIKVNSANT